MHRGDPSAGRDAGGRPGDGGGDGGLAQGARRARDARGPGAQRPGPGEPRRRRDGQRIDDRGALLPRHAPRIERDGADAGRPHLLRRLSRLFATGDGLRRAEDSRHGDHRRPRTPPARPLFRRHRLLRVRGQHGHLRRPAHPGDEGRRGLRASGRRRRLRQRPRGGVPGDAAKGGGADPRDRRRRGDGPALRPAARPRRPSLSLPQRGRGRRGSLPQRGGSLPQRGTAGREEATA